MNYFSTSDQYNDLSIPLQILEKSHDAVAVVNTEKKVLYISESCKDIYGYNAEEFKSDPTLIASILHPDYQMQFQNFRESYAANNTFPENFITMGWIHKNGHTVYTEQTFANIYNEQHQLVGFVTLIRNVTNKITAQKKLQENEFRYHNIFNNVALGIIQVNSTGEFVECNDNLLEIFGTTREKLSKINLIKLLEKKGFSSQLKQVLSGGKAVFEGVFQSFTGTKAPYIRAVANALLNKEKLFTGAIILIEDITQQKKIEEELQNMQKIETIGRLAGGIAHDYNNILTGIMGNISLVKIRTDPMDKNFEFLKRAEDATIDAKNLTQKLLSFSRGGTPDKKPISIETLLKETVRISLSGSNVLPLFLFKETLPNISADKIQISQAINNIIVNAKESMPGGGILRITGCLSQSPKESNESGSNEKYVRISFKDEGTGIDPEVINKVFDPFFTTRNGAQGLGLSIAYSITYNHQGHIRIHSEKGLGSEVSVYLPLTNTIALSPKKADSIKISKGAKILIMDDQDLVRFVLGEILESIGARVDFAVNGEEAIDLYSESLRNNDLYAAVILDLTVPGGMGGKEAGKYILALDKNAKIILSSGYSNDHVLSHYKDFGFFNMLRKPYNMDEINQLFKKTRTSHKS